VATDKPKLIMYIDEDLLEAVESFRFKYRFPNRTAAVMWLLRYAISQKPVPRRRKKKEDDE